MSELETERQIYRQKNLEISARQSEIEKHEKKISELRDEIAKSKGDIIKKSREKAAAMVRETKREAEEIISNLKEQFDDLGVKKRQQAIQNARDKIRTAEFENAEGIVADKSVGKRINKKLLREGDTIYIKQLDQKGIILSIEKGGSELQVQVGTLKTTVKSSACRFVSRACQSKFKSRFKKFAEKSF